MSSILIVEDDRSTCLFLSETLKAAGFTVASAKNGADALKCLGAGSYDLMLLDVWMPEMNGLEVQARLRRISPATRVVMLTAKDDPSVRRIAMNAGASAFFTKGVESDDFLAGVKAAADSGS